MLKQDESHREWMFKCFMVAGLVAWEIKCADDKTAHLIALYDGLRSSHSFGSMIWSFLLGCHYELGVGMNAVYKPRWKKQAQQQVYAVFSSWEMEYGASRYDSRWASGTFKAWIFERLLISLQTSSRSHYRAAPRSAEELAVGEKAWLPVAVAALNNRPQWTGLSVDYNAGLVLYVFFNCVLIWETVLFDGYGVAKRGFKV